jgi:glycosyltransferase involved in cell wall biosynthesis
LVLGVDVSRLVGPRTGVGRYLEHVLAEWARQPVPFDEVRLFSPAAIDDLPVHERFTAEILSARADGIWWQTVRLAPAAREVDVLFAPYTLPPRLRPPGVVANLGILGGAHAARSLRARARHLHSAWSARRAAVVIAHSEATRGDIVRYFGVGPEMLRVIHTGVENAFRPSEPGEEEGLRREVGRIAGDLGAYLLFVGKISTRRHLPALLDALARLRAGGQELSLIVAGPNSDGLPLDELFARPELHGAVRHFRHLDHGALDDASVRDAVISVPDPDPAKLAAAVGRLLDDAPLREELRGRGLAIARSLTWALTAKRTMQLLADVARAGR